MNAKMKRAPSTAAKQALSLVEDLQNQFVQLLQDLQASHGMQRKFEQVNWLRDGGEHGGGSRFEAPIGGIFNRGSVNTSQVHYPNDSARPLASATALSTIIHPENPLVPSVHIHISWTEMRQKKPYWRLMADLNPAISFEEDREAFRQTLTKVLGQLWQEAESEGERYFFIPALNRHRGICHAYLEGYASEDAAADLALARSFGEAVIERYVAIITAALAKRKKLSPDQYRQQLDYHTLYFFQVLTLDRGTTAGLLVHDQNDVGILGSLPASINRQLLESWQPRLVPIQQELLQVILNALPKDQPCSISTEVKSRLADSLRQFYKEHPAALDLQASGQKTPDTVGNHRP